MSNAPPPAVFGGDSGGAGDKGEAEASGPTKLSAADLELYQKLDLEYDRAMEEREISYAARYNNVRQSACFALVFMAIFLVLGALFFMRQSDWDFTDSMYFCVSTITTVGYGSLSPPNQAPFQIYTIFFVLIGTATLTILFAQIYQLIALEAGRAQHSRDQAEMIRKGVDLMATHQGKESAVTPRRIPLIDRCFRCFDRIKNFLIHDHRGQFFSVMIPFVILIVIGAAVVGSIEGWSPVESLYFSVISLTTVGYGDYYPTKKSSRMFCIFWLPFSVAIMSIYLGSVASFYIRLSKRNVARIERTLRRRVTSRKQKSQAERDEVLKRALGAEGEQAEKEGFDSVPTDATDDGKLFGSPESSENVSSRRDRIMADHQRASATLTTSSEDSSSTSYNTMRDIVQAVHSNASLSLKNTPEAEFFVLRSNKGSMYKTTLDQGSIRKPSFALRVLVQERFAEIIAMEIAGYESGISIEDNTLSITINALKDAADKWNIPKGSRRAFRSSAFECLYLVGERGLITRGVDALMELNPFEFHRLFAPLLADLGDADTMEGWLASTEILAEVDLHGKPKTEIV